MRQTRYTLNPRRDDPKKRLRDQFVAYFLVASIGLCSDISVLYLLTEFVHMPYLFSALCGYLIGLSINFYLSEKFVFGYSRISNWAKRLGLFAMVGIVGLCILEILMWMLVDFIGVAYLYSKLLATGIVYLWNFFARREIYKN